MAGQGGVGGATEEGGRLGDGSLPLVLERHVERAPEPPHGCLGAGVGAGQPQAHGLVQQLVARGGALRQVDAGEAGQGSGAKRGTHCCCGCWEGTGSEGGKPVAGSAVPPSGHEMRPLEWQPLLRPCGLGQRGDVAIAVHEASNGSTERKVWSATLAKSMAEGVCILGTLAFCFH